MIRYLFSTLLLLLLVSCASCSATSAESEIELFKTGRINALEPNGTGHEEIRVRWFEHFSLFFANGVMVGQVHASVGHYQGYLLTKYIGIGGDKWTERATEDGGKNWEAQWASEGQIVGLSVSAFVAKNDTIYGLHVIKAVEPTSEKQWEFLLSTGKVTHGDKGAISIVWENKTVEERFTKDIQTKLKNVGLGYGSGFVMEDGTFVFVITGYYDDTTRIFTIAHSKDPSTDLTFHFDDETAPHCYPNYFTWKEKLLMFPLYCDYESDYKLWESDDMGKTWSESSGKLAENLFGRELTNTYIPITIGERRLLLFTQAQRQENEIYDINLFAAYNDRIKPLGKIFTVFGSFTSGSLLYTKDELFYLGSPKWYITNCKLFRLEKQMEEIKKLIKGTP